MKNVLENLRQVRSTGAGCQESVVAPWGGVLPRHGIQAAGFVVARDGYRFITPHPTVALLYACLSGRGEVWAGGGWRVLSPGEVYLGPVGRGYAYRTVPGVEWRNCWVVFPDNACFIVREPTVIAADTRPLFSAIQGIYDEDRGRGNPEVLDHYAALILTFSRRVGRGEESGRRRLHDLWADVSGRLDHPWTLRECCERAGCSEETLRLLCRKEVCCSPMEYVTRLRMRHAAWLLLSTDDPITSIAADVCYGNALAFTTAFKRAYGVPPSKYRRQRHS